MPIGRLTTALALVMATACLAACTSDDPPAAGAVPPATSTPADSSGTAPDQPDLGEVPPIAGSDRTVGAYDADEVAAAATTSSAS